MTNIRIQADFAERFANFYNDLPRLEQTIGRLTPQDAVDRLLDYVLIRNGRVVRWCHGYGKPHLWLLELPTNTQFVRPCGEHAERRKIARRGSDCR